MMDMANHEDIFFSDISRPYRPPLPPSPLPLSLARTSSLRCNQEPCQLSCTCENVIMSHDINRFAIVNCQLSIVMYLGAGERMISIAFQENTLYFKTLTFITFDYLCIKPFHLFFIEMSEKQFKKSRLVQK